MVADEQPAGSESRSTVTSQQTTLVCPMLGWRHRLPGFCLRSMIRRRVSNRCRRTPGRAWH